MNATRYAWIDWLKAFGIISIVVGHTPLPGLISQGFSLWRSAFTIPLFFCVSGFLISPERLDLSLRDYANGRIKRIFYAYILFAGLGVAHLCLISQFGRNREALSEVLPTAVVSALYGSAHFEVLPRWVVYPISLWYFPAAILTGLLLFFCWAPRRNWIRALLVALVFSAGLLAHHLALPWSLQSACIAMVFVAVGQVMRRHPGWVSQLKSLSPFRVVLILVLGSELALHNGRFDLRAAQFGNPLLSFPAAFLLVAVFAWVFMKLPSVGLIALVADSTLLIFPAHAFVFWLVDDVARAGLRLPQDTMDYSIGYNGVKVAFTIVVLLAAYPPFARLFSFLGRADRTTSLPLARAAVPRPGVRAAHQPRPVPAQDLASRH